MDNSSSILLIFLIAALNTLIVVIAINLIFKIRMRKRDLAEQIKTEIQTDINKANISNVQSKLLSKEKLKNEPEDSDSKKNEVYPEKEHPKFLKYTPKGYIDPGKDEKKKQHVWR